MGLKEWFGGKKKDAPKTPEVRKSEEAPTLSPEQREAAKQKFREDVDMQLNQLRTMIDSTTDPKTKERLQEILRKREGELGD